MAFMLLASCRLADNEQQLVMSAIVGATYETVKTALKRIFASEITSASSCFDSYIKTEPVFLLKILVLKFFTVGTLDVTEHFVAIGDVEAKICSILQEVLTVLSNSKTIS